MTPEQMKAMQDAVALVLAVAGEGMGIGDICSETLWSDIVVAFGVEDVSDADALKAVCAILEEARND